KHWHLTLGDELENQRTDTGSEQRYARAHAGDQWHQHQRAECHEQHLRAGQHTAPAGRVHVLHQCTSFCRVPNSVSTAALTPRMIYSCSFRLSPCEAVKIFTSGCAVLTRSMPAGAAASTSARISCAPARLSRSMVVIIELPVASI